MKFEIVWEHVTHWAMVLVILGLCGLLVPCLIIVLGCGEFCIEALDLQRFGLDEASAKVMWGVVGYVAFTVATRAWFIEGCIDEYSTMVRTHRDTLDRLKNGPAYFRRRIAAQ